MARSVLRYSDEVREQILYLKGEGKSHEEIGKAVGLEAKQVTWFLGNYYRKLHREDPKKYPHRKSGRQAKPEPTRKELEKIIKEQKKLIKLYEDFLHLSGRM